jgi:hypothetical protein
LASPFPKKKSARGNHIILIAMSTGKVISSPFLCCFPQLSLWNS